MRKIYSVKRVWITIGVLVLMYSWILSYAEASPTNETNTITNSQPIFSSNEIIIKYKQGASLTNIADKQKGKVNKKISRVRLGEIKIPAGARVQEEIFKYKLDPAVEFVQPNYIYKVAAIPDDTRYNEQWGLEKIKAPQAWDTTTGSVTIAIVDTGVDANHPDLTDNLVAGYNTINNTVNTDDDYGHGTHVAGIAAGVSNNTIGIAGVAGTSKIMPIKAMGSNGTGYSSDVSEGIIWAADHGAKVINLSVGFGGVDPVMQTAVDYAYNQGVVLVASAGNSNTSGKAYPAGYDHVVAVSATDQNDQKATFSNYGSHIDVTAPGVAILSTTFDGAYGLKSGTSMSAPYVSGVAALVISQRPTLTPGQVERVLQTSATDIGTAGKDNYFGYGLVDAEKALTQPVDTSAMELGVVSVTPNTIKSGSMSKITFMIGSQGYVTVKIKDNSGNVVRTLLDHVLKNAGTTYVTWNGKTSTNLSVASGDYTYEVQAEDLAGNLSTPMTGTITVDNTVPVITNLGVTTSPFAPNGSNSTSINYDLSEQSKVIAKVYNSKNGLVATLANLTLQNTGSNTLTWNGKNSSSVILGDGTYTVKIDATDIAGLKAVQKTTTIVIEANNPTVTGVSDSPDPFRPLGANVNTIKYSLSENANVTIKIYDGSNNLVKTLLNNSLVTAGAKTITWNGKNDAGTIVTTGTYTYKIDAVDGLAKSAVQVTGTIAVDVTSPTISGVNVSINPFTPTGNYTTISFNLSETSKVTVAIYNSSNVLTRKLLTSITKTAGANSVNWYGTNSTNYIVPAGNYTYKIDAVDLVGNKATQVTGSITIQ